ncbi:MAG: hypothetical protein ACD_8C00094G0015 [uncultured bacterium]|nr:MAG: hypothetical protein ACD_8C00094G0015 [uncultured bacterium]
MLINVPQYIDVEDKIVGPITAKQLGWLIGGSILLLILWNTLSFVMFCIIGFPVAVVFLSFAFFKPYGQPLGSFVVFGILYYFRPKIYVWKRTPQKVTDVAQKIQAQTVVVPDKHITQESLRNLARLLDSEGQNSNSDLEMLLKKAPKK